MSDIDAEFHEELPALPEEQRILPGLIADAAGRGSWPSSAPLPTSGIVSQFGEVREWMSGEGANPVKARLEPIEEGTLVAVSQSTEPFASQPTRWGGGADGAPGGFGANDHVGRWEGVGAEAGGEDPGRVGQSGGSGDGHSGEPSP